MKLLRDSMLFRALHRRAAARATDPRRTYTITVPAPLPRPSARVVEWRRAGEPTATAAERSTAASVSDDGAGLPFVPAAHP
jgi:hypothetical protein